MKKPNNLKKWLYIKIGTVMLCLFMFALPIIAAVAIVEELAGDDTTSIEDIQSQYLQLDFVTGKFKKTGDDRLKLTIYDQTGKIIYVLNGFLDGNMIILTGDDPNEDTTAKGQYKAGKYEVSGTLGGQEFWMKGPRSSADGYVGEGAIALGQLEGASGKLIFPVANGFYGLTSDYAVRKHPIFGYVHQHTGVDLWCKDNADIVAAAPGVVSYAGWNGGYGNMVEIKHAGGLVTRYGHNDTIFVSVGDKVKGGELLAAAGSTGNSTGTHCHFEVMLKGQLQDPKKYITIPH